MKKPTKDQLLLQNGELVSSVQSWSNLDATRRKQFAKVIGRTDNRYGMHETPSDLSWEEIFCEIGKLMAFRDFHQWKQDIEFRMDLLKSEVHKSEQ